MRIYLVGYMGSGKSTMGKELAKKFHYRFLDLDNVIEKKTGKRITDIFQKSEESFRKLEKKYLHETEKSYNTVIATGGGAAAYADNMAWMKEHGITVYLKVSPGALFHRLVKEKKERPLISHLSDVELMEQVMTHLATREPFYRQAKHKIEADKTSVDKIVKLLKK